MEILRRERAAINSGKPRVRDHANFQEFARSRTEEIAQRMAGAPGFVFEPESRAGYAAQLGLPSDHDQLRLLWEFYQDGEDVEYELLRFADRTEIFACLYRHYITALISLQGQDTFWGEQPQPRGIWGTRSLHVELSNSQQRVLLENRRLTRLMLADVEIEEPFLDASMTTYNLEVWAPMMLRKLAMEAAVELASSAGTQAMTKLNRKMAAQVDADTAIYRWYDARRRPIYYGIAGDLGARQDQHARTSQWSVFAAYCEVTRVSTRRLALDEERRLIQRDQPVFNRQHNDTPEARDRYALYLAERGRLDLVR